MRSLLFLGNFWICLHFFSQNSTCNILPTPVTFVKAGSGNEFLETQKLSFDSNACPEPINVIFAEIAKLYLPSAHNYLDHKADKGLIKFQYISGGYPDSYSLNITSKEIRIAYTSPASCFYALHSLFQLIQINPVDSSLKLPLCFVKDYPKFSWRGLHLDVARHFFTVDEVKKYLDLMSMYKFNIFHWHLTDDQGWRIEIKRYPKLTEIGAWRDSTVENHYATSPRTWNTKRYGGFYTQEQIREVVAYAADRQITIVPEIEMPGHARAALAAYPEYSCSGKQQPVPGLWGVFEDVFCTKDSSLHFLQNILEEVMELFPSQYIHVGGDEVPKTRWKTCPNCQKKKRILELKDETELQSYFIGQMDQYLKKRGRNLMGWDEILEGGLSPGAAVMSWRGTEGGIAAAQQGHFVVMSPGSHCYFDHYQSKSTSEPLAIGGYTPLEKVYDFQPVPQELSAQEAPFILGGQANLWTEYIPSFDQLTYMTYPRAIALSQVLWGGSKAPYQTFEEVLKTHHIPRLMGPILNTHTSLSFMKPSFKFKRIPNGISLGFEFKDTRESVAVSSNDGHDGVWLDHEKTLDFKRTIKKTRLYNLTFLSPCCADSLTLISHQGLGAQVSYETPPNERYNSGDLTLVDGQFGARPWRGNQWAGFDTNTVKVRLDFGKRIRITELELGFLYEPTSWIHLPLEIRVSTNRGKDQSYKVNNERCNLKFQAKSDHIFLHIEGLKTIPIGFPGEGNIPWIFCDEFVIK
ncbi:MAG: beta-N-acetylhexosaminidase [Bacteroidetes bacterium]|nr:beta-N-acetylhexosaminidase [Bacteroidota bacterium]MBM3425138.1 beta-N-acetylhexosaminidase [Bacteroidota bacterium]